MPNVKVPIKVSPWDVTTAFVDVLQIWSEFLNGQRANTAPEVLAAWEWLSNGGFDIPDQALSMDDLVALRVMSQRAGQIAGQPNVVVSAADIANARSISNNVNSYLEGECNLSLDPAIAPAASGQNPLEVPAPGIAQTLPVNSLPATNLVPNAPDYGSVDDGWPYAQLSPAEQGLAGGQLDAGYWIPVPADPENDPGQWTGIPDYYVPPPPGGGNNNDDDDGPG